MDNVGQVVGQIWYTPQSFSVINAAIIAAGLPKRDQLPPYEKFVAEFDRTTAELEERGIMSKRVSVNAASLLEWCADHGLSPDADARAQYIRAAYGKNPMKRIREMQKRFAAAGLDMREHQRSGVLCCWDNGTASRWRR